MQLISTASSCLVPVAVGATLLPGLVLFVGRLLGLICFLCWGLHVGCGGQQRTGDAVAIGIEVIGVRGVAVQGCLRLLLRSEVFAVEVGAGFLGELDRFIFAGGAVALFQAKEDFAGGAVPVIIQCGLGVRMIGVIGVGFIEGGESGAIRGGFLRRSW